MPAHLDIYEKHGFAAQSRHLGKPFAYLFTESGEVNTLVHMWLYDDVADRAKKRAAMAADPEWQNYLRLNNEAGYDGLAAEQPDAADQVRTDHAVIAAENSSFRGGASARDPESRGSRPASSPWIPGSRRRAPRNCLYN